MCIRDRVNAYPETGRYAVVNNSSSAQTTQVYDGQGNGRTLDLEPCEIKWYAIEK